MTNYLARVAAAGARASAPARPPIAAPTILPKTVASVRPLVAGTISPDDEAALDLSTRPATSPVSVPSQTDGAPGPPGVTGPASIVPARPTALARAPRSPERSAVSLEPGVPYRPTAAPSTGATSRAPLADSPTTTEPTVDDAARVSTPRLAQGASPELPASRAPAAPAAGRPALDRLRGLGAAGGAGGSRAEREILPVVVPGPTPTAIASSMQVPPPASTVQPAAPRARVVVGRLDVQVHVTSGAPPLRPAQRTSAAAMDPLTSRYLDRFGLG